MDRSENNPGLGTNSTDDDLTGGGSGQGGSSGGGSGQGGNR